MHALPNTFVLRGGPKHGRFIDTPGFGAKVAVGEVNWLHRTLRPNTVACAKYTLDVIGFIPGSPDRFGRSGATPIIRKATVGDRQVPVLRFDGDVTDSTSISIAYPGGARVSFDYDAIASSELADRFKEHFAGGPDLL